MDIKHLKHFVTVVNEGVNLSKAAKKLHISQPPLSQQMKNIEDTLNVQIFERGKRNFKKPEMVEKYNNFILNYEK